MLVGGMPERLNGAVSKTVVRLVRTEGSNPSPSARLLLEKNNTHNINRVHKMSAPLHLFRLNRGISTRAFEEDFVLTPDLCIQNCMNGIETTLHLDTNIISAIRIFTFNEKQINETICKRIEQFIELYYRFKVIFISPGMAFYETREDYKEKNITAFNIFCHNHLRGISDAYNATEYKALDKREMFYLFNTWASFYAMRHVRDKYKDLKAIEKFEIYTDILQEHLDIIDGMLLSIAGYAFVESNKLSQSHKKIVDNFIKKEKKKKTISELSKNAAYDLVFLRGVAGSEYMENPESFRGKVQGWGLTADKGLSELTKVISCDLTSSPLMICDMCGAEEYLDELQQCNELATRIYYERKAQNKMTRDKDQIVSKAETLIAKLENGLI